VSELAVHNGTDELEHVEIPPDEETGQAGQPMELEELNESLLKVRRNQERIFRARRELIEEQRALEDLQEEVKEQRSVVKRKAAYLHNLIGNLEAGENSLPFDDPEDDDVEDTAGKTSLQTALQLTDNATQIFQDADLHTVSDLEEYIRSDPYWWQKLAGVGETTADALCDALVQFREEHPVPSAEEE